MQDVFSKYSLREDSVEASLPWDRALAQSSVAAELRVYINGDGADVYEDRFLSLATTEDGCFTPTLILVGIRLGIDRVTPVYWEALKGSLQLPQSDWHEWRRSVTEVQGKPVVHVTDREPVMESQDADRQAAVYDVETLDDEDGDDGELIEHP
ncbi:MAG: hypothetical protein Q9211_000153 [Gyalolechia sp. 1 TL-2023]